MPVNCILYTQSKRRHCLPVLMSAVQATKRRMLPKRQINQWILDLIDMHTTAREIKHTKPITAQQSLKCAVGDAVKTNINKRLKTKNDTHLRLHKQHIENANENARKFVGQLKKVFLQKGVV